MRNTAWQTTVFSAKIFPPQMTALLCVEVLRSRLVWLMGGLRGVNESSLRSHVRWRVCVRLSRCHRNWLTK